MFFVECINTECSFHLRESSLVNISVSLHHLFHSRGVQRSVARPFIQNVIWFWQAASLHVHILDESESLGPRYTHLQDRSLVPNCVVAMPSALTCLLQKLENRRAGISEDVRIV